MLSLLSASFGSIMMNILYVVIAICVLLTMVLIHELGHYIAGRLLGFKITEFSIGFGKVLWQKTNKRGEKISLRLFPLGGFCAFLGENDDETTALENTKVLDEKAVAVSKEEEKDQSVDKSLIVENAEVDKVTEKLDKIKKDNKAIYDDSGEFNKQKPWKRIIVYFAGVTFNFISAFLFAIIFLCVGGYDACKIAPTEGYTVSYYSVTTGDVAGTLSSTDEYIVHAIDGKNINFARSRTFESLLANKDEATLTISINGGEITDIVIKKASYPVEQKDGTIKDEMLFGLTKLKNVNLSYGFSEVLRDFVPFTFEISILILKAFWSIITGQIALNQLGGPVSTITQMTQVASYGIANFLYLLPMLAANLAIFNILPIPGLDGAHVVFTTIEWIRGKPMKRNIENAIHGWGIILLFAFVIIIDIIHLVT